MDVNSAIAQFLSNLTVERRLSRNTVNAHRRDLTLFKAELTAKNVAILKTLRSDVRRFLAAQYRDGLKATTISRRMSALKAFFKFLVRQGTVPSNPCETLKSPKTPRRSPRFLSPDDTERLLQVAEGDSPVAIRDRTLLELASGGGLRVSELCGIDIGDLDLDSGTVRVRGKGNKERIVPIGRMAILSVRTWLNLRHQIGEGGHPSALFRNKFGGRLSVRTVQRLVARGRTLCLQGGATPHWLRHACATHMLSSGPPLNTRLLGHASLSTTQKYTHVDVAQLMSVMTAHIRGLKQLLERHHCRQFTQPSASIDSRMPVPTF